MLEKFLLLGLCALVSCSITCPDGQMKCSDQATCCLTEEGYRCCPYPHGVCCADRKHCCPSDFQCNPVTEMCERRWESRPLLRTGQASAERGQAPAERAPTVVYCDNYYTCPDGYTCCRHPSGGWSCCPYSLARCCLDGHHCCPYGYDCDYTYTHCIRQSVPFPFGSPVPGSRPADKTLTALEPALREGGVIRCDSSFFCRKGSSCCKGPTGQWNCCPYPLGICCADGKHCCEYGYTCDPSSQVCRRVTSTL